MLRALPLLLIRLFIVLVASLSLAHGADSPGLLDSLGKLLAAASAAPPPAVGNRTLNVSPAGQGRRIALVIGNGDYQYPDNLPRLANPANDAQDIAEALRGFGFEVIERRNQTLEAMNQTIAEFGSRIGGSEAALFYFAGHGIQVKNQNYLMPVNARIDSEAAVPYQGVDLNRILDEMDNAKSSANIVMLDACRNNPISGKFRSGKSRGLASPGSAPKGTVIVYATDPGNVAADGDGRNGLFTAGLLTAFKGKDLSLDDVLTVASAEVERASGQTQTPYVNGPKTLQKNFNFRVTVDPGRGESEKTFWNSIERSTDPADFEAYLRKFPKGSYRALAENQIKRLKAGPAATAPAAQTAVAPAPTFSAPIKSDDPETQFWTEVKSSGSREYLDAYLKKYPKGKYVTLARINLKILDEQDKTQRAKEAAEKQQALARAQQEASRAEQAAWEQAKAASSSAAYAGYLERYPAGRYAELAQAAQQRLQREASELERQAAARAQAEKAEAVVRAEAELWRKAESAANSATVQDYIERYPAGRHIAEARIRLAAVKKAEAEIPPGKFANSANPRIEMTTSQGSMIIELYQDKAPKSVENFLQYARDGFFDGTIFHRVIPGFMIQGGGFTPDMRQKDTRAPIQNEAKNGLRNETGTLSMARKAEPHSANAQFFINTNDNSALDYPSRDGWGYAVFGKVVQGMETVQKIASVPTGNASGHQNVPTTPVHIHLVKPLTPAK